MEIRKALVLGMARSGAAAARLLLARGCEVIICDQKAREAFKGALDDLDVPGVHWRLGEQDPLPLLEGMDALILSPGIPDTHPAVVRARELGVEVMGELEYAYRESTGLLLAVTGTNGKTTTSTLLGEIFKNAGRRTWVVGNIGAPYAQAVLKMRAGDVTVCEVSSFQLETVSQFHPAVAAVLNVTEDHLNRHGTMENYIALKERVFANCREGDFVVLNYDNAVTRAMAAHTRAKVVWFSRSGEAPSGALARDGKVVFVDDEGTRPVCDTSEIYIPGPHNLENALAATAMALSAGVPAPVVRHTLRAFQGVEHRLEFVRELDQVRYINDSKGTNVDSTLWAVRLDDRTHGHHSRRQLQKRPTITPWGANLCAAILPTPCSSATPPTPSRPRSKTRASPIACAPATILPRPSQRRAPWPRPAATCCSRRPAQALTCSAIMKRAGANSRGS